VAATGPVGKAVHVQPRAAVAPVSEANAFKAKLSAQLAHTPLAAKVNIQATGNALTLSGNLAPEEYHKLLSLLHSLPASVKVIDDINAGSATEQLPAN
jgi:hypothetical protein